jgi:hypothetical protein
MVRFDRYGLHRLFRTSSWCLQAFPRRSGTVTRCGDTTTVSCASNCNSPGIPPATRESRRHAGLRCFKMARPGLEPGTPRFSVLRPNLSNRAKSPAIKRLLVGSPREAEVGYLRTFALQLGTQISLGTQSTPMAATSPSERQTACATRSPRRIVQCASQSRCRCAL